MEIKVSTENGRVPVTIIHIDGNLDSSSHTKFQARAEELIKGGAHHILVDLSSQTKTVFTTTGFDMYIEEYDDLKKAIAAF